MLLPLKDSTYPTQAKMRHIEKLGISEQIVWIVSQDQYITACFRDPHTISLLEDRLSIIDNHMNAFRIILRSRASADLHSSPKNDLIFIYTTHRLDLVLPEFSWHELNCHVERLSNV